MTKIGWGQSIHVRAAKFGEIDLLTELCIRSKRSNGYDDAFMDACINELTITAESFADGQYWVAEADPATICGVCALHTTDEPDCFEVHSFFIDPVWQRLGVGKLLWEALLIGAKKRQLKTLRLDADPHAVAFYESLGFVHTGKKPSGSIPGRYLPQMGIRIAD